MEGVLNKLKTLGSRGERVLEMLKSVDKTKFYDNTASTVTEDLVTKKDEQFITKSKFLLDVFLSFTWFASLKLQNIYNLIIDSGDMEHDEASNAKKTSEVNNATETTQTSEEAAKLQIRDALLRQKRDLILKTTELERDLSTDDEEKENLGIEEVMIILFSFKILYI